MQFRVFFSLSILLLGIYLCISGCLNVPGAQETSPTIQTTEPTIVPTSSVTVIETFTPLETPTAIRLSSEDINLHFMDVAFGSGTIYLVRLPPSSKRTTISLNAGTDADRQTIEAFTAKFNSLSQSNMLFENPKVGQTGDIRIKFLSPEGMRAVDMDDEMDWLNREFSCDGVTCAKIKGYDIYLNSDMKGDQRTHYLLRSLLYTLGFKGDSLQYPDSIFAYPENTVTELSFLDEKAIQVMYGLGMYDGMTVYDVKGVLFFK